ncbi:unnamed protein product [Clonostachys rhizophaga]|uniref:Uncharacterized protein n=1 Tax=Clonostachys rhizophaga TaxID=160324 RepID=A0A9N9VSK2_9HYPO|nr:unnamed protein product [Clonostachys rhizophaga]
MDYLETQHQLYCMEGLELFRMTIIRNMQIRIQERTINNSYKHTQVYVQGYTLLKYTPVGERVQANGFVRLYSTFHVCVSEAFKEEQEAHFHALKHYPNWHPDVSDYATII